MPTGFYTAKRHRYALTGPVAGQRKLEERTNIIRGGVFQGEAAEGANREGHGGLAGRPILGG